MRQKLQDLQTLLKKDRKTQVITGVLILAGLFLLLGDSTPTPRSKREKEKAGVGLPNSNERYEDLVASLRVGMNDLKDQQHQTGQRLNEFMRQTEENEKRTVEIFRRLIERMADVEAAAMNVNMHSGKGGPGVIDIDDPNARAGVNLSDGDIAAAESLESFGELESPISPIPQPPVKRLAVVGAGDSVRIKLLSGVNAPTDGTPYPVVFQLLDDVIGPDGSALPLGEARLVAAAQGSLTDSRALFRLSSLNVRLPNGRRKVVPVDGWVVGEDGIRGMRGVLLDPLGKTIMGAGIAGGLDGLGRAVSGSNSTITTNIYGQQQEFVTGDDMEYAAGKALSGASREWASVIRERADQMVPHVEVLSGRTATAVFLKSFVIDDLIEALEENEEGYVG